MGLLVTARPVAIDGWSPHKIEKPDAAFKRRFLEVRAVHWGIKQSKLNTPTELSFAVITLVVVADKDTPRSGIHTNDHGAGFGGPKVFQSQHFGAVFGAGTTYRVLKPRRRIRDGQSANPAIMSAISCSDTTDGAITESLTFTLLLNNRSIRTSNESSRG